jgi:hypothetical protein
MVTFIIIISVTRKKWGTAMSTQVPVALKTSQKESVNMEEDSIKSRSQTNGCPLYWERDSALEDRGGIH